MKPVIVELGDGSMAMALFVNDEGLYDRLGFVRTKSKVPIAVWMDNHLTDEQLEDDTELIIKFSNMKSIDAVINNAQSFKRSLQ